MCHVPDWDPVPKHQRQAGQRAATVYTLLAGFSVQIYDYRICMILHLLWVLGNVRALLTFLSELTYFSEEMTRDRCY